MTPPQDSLIQFFNSQGLGRLSTAQAKLRVRIETVENVLGDGRYLIQGKSIATTGEISFRVGDRVHVVFRGDEPLAILGHNWRRAKFDPEPAPPVVGEWQNIVAEFDDGGTPAIFLSTLTDTFAFDLLQFGVEAEGGDDDILYGGFCANDPSIILVVTETNLGSDPSGRALRQVALILIKINRASTESRIPTDGEIQLQPSGPTLVTFPKLDVSLIRRTEILNTELQVRNLNVNINFKHTLLAGQWEVTTDPRSPPILTSTSDDQAIVTNALLSGSIQSGPRWDQGDYFCIKQGGEPVVFALIREEREIGATGAMDGLTTISVGATSYSANFTLPSGVDLDESFNLPRSCQDNIPAQNCTGLASITDEVTRTITTEDINVNARSFAGVPILRTFPVDPLYFINLTTKTVLYRNVNADDTITLDQFAGTTDGFQRRFQVLPQALFTLFRKTFIRQKGTAFLVTNSGAPFGEDPAGSAIPPEATHRLGGREYFPATNPYTIDPFKQEASAASKVSLTGPGRQMFPVETFIVSGHPSSPLSINSFPGKTIATNRSNQPDVTGRTRLSQARPHNFVRQTGPTSAPFPVFLLRGSGANRDIVEWQDTTLVSLTGGQVAGVTIRLINETQVMASLAGTLTILNRMALGQSVVSQTSIDALDLFATTGIQLMTSRKRLYFPAKEGNFTVDAGLIAITSDEAGELLLTPTTRLPRLTNPDNYFQDDTGRFGLTSALFPATLENG